MAIAGLVSALLLVCAPAVLALPACKSDTVELPAVNKMVFAVIGDWGRVGAQDSLFNPYTVQLCEQTGMCCSDLQRPDLPANFDYSDTLDGPQQRMTAVLMDDVCGTVGCQFVLGMGDNFYPCGADAPESGLNRYVSDWEAIYHSDSVPSIRDLKWYHVVGNHDYGTNFSVNSEISYSQQDDRWVLPSAYYSKTFVAGDISMKVEFLDETPFVYDKRYVKAGGAYYTNFLTSLNNPAYINSDAAQYVNKTTGLCTVPPGNASFITNISDSATGQVPWLKSCLESSNSTWDVVVGHYSLYGSDVNWATNNSKTGGSGNCGAWASTANLVKQSADAYFNGHDHTQTHADPLHAGVLVGAEPSNEGYGNMSYLVSASNQATQYFTLGNGGSIQYGDGVTLGAPKSYNDQSDVIYNQNIQYSADVLSADAATGNAAVGEGFAIVEVDECTMVVKFYNIESYTPGLAGSQAASHTTVINKCGTATMAQAATQ